MPRWFSTVIPWEQVFVLLFRHHLFRPNEPYILAGDEAVVTKAGQDTFGLDRFFSGILQKMVPIVSFFALAFVSPTEHCAVPIRVEQTVRTEAKESRRPGQTRRSVNPDAHAQT